MISCVVIFVNQLIFFVDAYRIHLTSFSFFFIGILSNKIRCDMSLKSCVTISWKALAFKCWEIRVQSAQKLVPEHADISKWRKVAVMSAYLMMLFRVGRESHEFYVKERIISRLIINIAAASVTRANMHCKIQAGDGNVHYVRFEEQEWVSSFHRRIRWVGELREEEKNVVSHCFAKHQSKRIWCREKSEE